MSGGGRVRAWVHDNVLAGDLLALPTARELSIDPEALMRAAGVQRVSDLRPSHVRDVSDPVVLPGGSVEEVLAGPVGRQFARMLRRSLEAGVQLWLFGADAAQLERTHEIVGVPLVHVVGEQQQGRQPFAINPVELAEAWLGDDADPVHRAWAVEALSGVDTLRLPGSVVAALRGAGVPHVARTVVGRWLRDPAIFFYVVVLAWSAMRALPVSFVHQFHGAVWLLWTIDMVTAIPYTWGVIAMVTAKRASVRALGTLVGVGTFISPYVYFWVNGDDYPWWVVVIVAFFILSGLLIEIYKIVADRRITAALRQTGYLRRRRFARR